MLFLRLSAADLPSLASRRARPGWLLSADEGDGMRWLQCPESDSAETAAVPALERHTDNGNGLLIPQGKIVPAAPAPRGPWLPLADALPVIPSPARSPGRVLAGATVELVRTAHSRPEEALLTDTNSLARWAETAPRVRMDRLRFAAAEDGRAFVSGSPLPSLPGAPCYFMGALALPCGWEPAPHLAPAWLEKALAPPRGAVALIHPDGRVELISQESFLPLTLGAARRTSAARARSA